MKAALTALALVLFGSTCLASPQTTVAGVVRALVDKHTLPGAVVLVSDKNKVLSTDVAGSADIERGQPMRSDTVFWVASMTKSITAAALMILVDEGKIGLDDPASKYIPELRDLWLASERSGERVLLQRPKQQITVRSLLNHTSGLAPFSGVENSPVSKAVIPLAVLPLWLAVRGYGMTPLDFEPGSKWAYSNAAFNTAGRIIEVVSGMPYEEFLQKRIFNPLGMKDTTFSLSKRQLSRLAKSYRPNATKTGFDESPILSAEHPLTDSKKEPWPAGGLFSTAPDIARFCQMMLSRGLYGGKRILSESAVHQMTINHVPASAGVQYGLGWFIGYEGAYLHMGAHGTIMIVYPQKELIVVILFEHTTIQQGNSWDVYNPIIEAAFKQHKIGS